MFDKHVITVEPKYFESYFTLDASWLLTHWQLYAIFILSLTAASLVAKNHVASLKSVSLRRLFSLYCLLSITGSLLINFIPDDSYAHYRVVDNLIRNGQYVFNTSEFVEGTATPLWHVLLYFYDYIGLDFILFGKITGMVVVPWLTLAQIMLAEELLDEKIRKKLFPLATALITLNPIIVIYASSGMETIIYALLACFFILFILRGLYNVAACFGILVVLMRFDGAPLVGLALLLGLVMYKQLKLNVKKLLWVSLMVAVTFISLTLFRMEYFGDSIPHVVKMKTLSDAKLSAGLSYLISFLFLFLVPGLVLIFALLKSRNLSGLSPKINYLLLLSISLLGMVTIGGGDWMPGSRYYVVPSCLLLACVVALITVTNPDTEVRQAFYSKYHFLYIIPLLTLWMPPPTPFRDGYMSLQSPIKFISILNNAADELYTVGILISYLNKGEEQKITSVYTRWIGFIPYNVGPDVRIIDELGYFHRWTEMELKDAIKTNKIGHLIETVSRIKTEKPNLITNVSNVRSPLLLNSVEGIREPSIYEQIIENTQLSPELKNFIFDNYRILEITTPDGEKSIELLVDQDITLESLITS